MKIHLTKPLIVFDIESTGLNVVTDRIVEISLLKIHVDNREEVRTYLINPGIPVPKEVIDIHGITNEMLADKPSFKSLAGELNAFIGNADLAGYNAIKFDVPMLVEEFLRAGIEFDLKNRRLVDVQNIFHKMEPRTLRAAYKFYCGGPLENAHSAEADTRATYDVLKAQLDRYDDAEYVDNQGNVSKPIVNEIRQLSEFSAMNRNVDLVGHIIYNARQLEVFNFGKHKGKTVEEVFRNEPSYYDWMMKGEFPLSTKRTITAIKLRTFNNK